MRRVFPFFSRKMNLDGGVVGTDFEGGIIRALLWHMKNKIPQAL